MHVTTVLGPMDAADIGRTLFHEHLLVKYPGAEFDPKSVFDRAAFIDEGVRRLTELREVHGVRTFVDPCPIELGRDVEAMARISERSEVNVICTTGFYHEQLGLPAFWRHSSAEQVAELYISEIEKGVLDTGIRAGALKCATGVSTISDAEMKCLEATAMAHKETGVSIITHTSSGSCGPEQQRALAGFGVDLDRIVVGHCCENPDGDYHRSIVDQGSYIGFDRIGWLQFQSDEVRADSAARLIKDGYASQLMLGQDRFTAMIGRHGRPVEAEEAARIERLKRENKWPPPYTYLFETFFPMVVERGVDEAVLYRILDENPRRFFGDTSLAA